MSRNKITIRSFYYNKWTALFLSNFLGVFNDNFLKNCIIFIGVSWSLPAWLSHSQLISIVSASMVVPFLVLSPYAGRLAVIHSKKAVFRFFRLLEIPIMILASISFYFHWILLAVFSVLLMGIHTSLHSPAKRSLIRDIGGIEGVSFGSGMFETMIFLAILIGTVTASIISEFYNIKTVIAIFIGVALLGYWFTREVKAIELPEEKEEIIILNPFRFLVESFRFARQHENVNTAVFGASAFWLVGAMFQMNLIIHTKNVYQESNSITGLVLAFAAIGIAMGSWATGKLSGHTVKKGFILIGISGISILMLTLTLFKPDLPLYMIIVFCIGFFGGFFQIPNQSMLQQADLGRKLGTMVGYLNLVTYIFVLIGTLFFSLTTHFTGQNSFAVFGAILFVCLIIVVYFLKVSPVYWQETARILKIKPSTE